MPSSSFPSPGGRLREERRVILEEMTRKELLKSSQCDVEEVENVVEKNGSKKHLLKCPSGDGDKEQVVNLDEFDDISARNTIRSRAQRSSTRIAVLATRKSLKSEAESHCTSPLKVRKIVKTARKVTVKKETKTKVKKEQVLRVKRVKSEEDAVGNESRGEDVGCKIEELDGLEDLGTCEDEKPELINGALPSMLPLQLEERNRLSDALKVKATIRIFNSMYLQAIQEEDKRALEKAQEQAKNKDVPAKRPSKRPDLKAISKMLKLKATLNPEKQIGAIPGVSVGQQFLSRAEMVVIGLHNHWLNGIDYIGAVRRAMNKLNHFNRLVRPVKEEKSQVKTAKEETSHSGGFNMPDWPGVDLPITVSIVISGGYEDDIDNLEDVTYTGQGGNNLTGDRRQIRDQKLAKGNLALKNSMIHSTPVRVIRGHVNKLSYTGKIYTYDGLYQVYDHWAEKGISGFTVFKYKLRRLPGQEPLTSKQVQFARGKVPDNVSELRGLVSKDVANKMEQIPVPASNTVDTPPFPPTDYTYMTTTVLSKDIQKPPPAEGCKCKGSCTDDQKCSCARKNGSMIPYVNNHGGRLMKAMDVVYECGPSCGCGPECINRTSQKGLQYRLEVYKTTSKGWAVRSWDYIPAGAPICEYIGTLRRNDERLESMIDNSYIFELDCVQTMQGMEGRQKRWGDVSTLADPGCDEDSEMHNAPMYVLDAGKGGSVSRFLNHSCEPNVFIQCILSDHHDVTMPRIVMFAADNIPPLEELCYDYGYAMDSVLNSDGTVKEMPCHCGAASCRKRMY